MDGVVRDLEEIAALLSEMSPDEVAEQARGLLESLHVEDVADVLERLDRELGVRVLQTLEDETAAEVLVAMPTEIARVYARDLPDTALAIYLDVLPMDDALDLREDIGDERFDALLEVIPDEDAEEIRRLLVYPEDSVGRMMTEAFFQIRRDMTMAEVLMDLRAASEEKYESINDLYVLGPDGRIQGVFSLRKALRAEPSVTAAELMNVEVIACHAYEPAEDAARRMSRYGLYALPVLDRRDRMVGLFTGDDAQDVLQEAETEDVLALGAVSGSVEAYLSLNVWQLARRRLPWLGGLFVAETLTGAVLRHYGQSEPNLQLSSLTYYIPLLIGAGGNAGSQVTTTVTRALALDEVVSSDWLRVLRREMAVALIIGATLAVVGFGRAMLWRSGLQLSLVVATALPLIVLWAGAVGSVLPLAAKRVGVDPAVMSAPFIATLVDATGLVIYFEIAKRFLLNG